MKSQQIQRQISRNYPVCRIERKEIKMKQNKQKQGLRNL